MTVLKMPDLNEQKLVLLEHFMESVLVPVANAYLVFFIILSIDK